MGIGVDVIICCIKYIRYGIYSHDRFLTIKFELLSPFMCSKMANLFQLFQGVEFTLRKLSSIVLLKAKDRISPLYACLGRLYDKLPLAFHLFFENRLSLVLVLQCCLFCAAFIRCFHLLPISLMLASGSLHKYFMIFLISPYPEDSMPGTAR